MKRVRVVFILVLALWVLAASAVPGLAAPKAVPADPVFEFTGVPEGQGITHEFTIKNQGDKPLNIIGVIPP